VVNDLIVLDQIDFEQGLAHVQISLKILDITSYLAEFDCSEIKNKESTLDPYDIYAPDDDDEDNASSS